MSGTFAVHWSKNKAKVSELVVVARAWLGWGSTTCDIERAFSQYQAIFGASRRGRMTRQREQDIVTLCADWHEHDQDAVVALIRSWHTPPRARVCCHAVQIVPGSAQHCRHGDLIHLKYEKITFRY